jgi:6-phosphofructokinase
MNKRIGIVTGGGDCPGLNTVIRAVAKAAAMRGWETLGILVLIDCGFSNLRSPLDDANGIQAQAGAGEVLVQSTLLSGQQFDLFGAHAAVDLA